MSFLSEEDVPLAPTPGVVHSMLPLRFGTTLEQLSDKPNTVEITLDLETRAGICGTVTALEFTDYSNSFPWDIAITVVPCSTADLTLESGSTETESWNKRVTVYNINVEYERVPDLKCSRPSIFDVLSERTLYVTEFQTYNYEDHTAHITSHPNDTHLVVHATHPFFKQLWHYAVLHCGRTGTDFATTSDIVCNKTKHSWRVPSTVLLEINESIARDIENLGDTVATSNLKLRVSRLDGLPWTHGVSEPPASKRYGCVMNLHVSAVHA